MAGELPRSRSLWIPAHYGGAAGRLKNTLFLFGYSALQRPAFRPGRAPAGRRLLFAYRVARHTAAMSDSPSPGWHGEPALPPAPMPLLAPLPPPQRPARPAARGWRGLLQAGLMLVLLRRPRLEGLRLGPGQFWLLLLLGLPAAAAVGWLGVEPPRLFSRFGLQTVLVQFLEVLLFASLLARMARKPELLWPLAVLLSAADLYRVNLTRLAFELLLPPLAQHHPAARWLLVLLGIAWAGLVLFRVLGVLQALRPGRALLAVLLMLGLGLGLAYLLPQGQIWRHDYSADAAEQPAGPPPLVAEEVFERQDRLLDRALAGLAPSQPGNPALYFVAYAPDGEQDVFMKEARYGTELFRRRFGAAQRAVTLVNNRQTVDELPMATGANLQRTLDTIGHRMNPEQDILFLYLTSHGSRDAELAVALDDISFSDFTAPRLAQILQRSGIRWKVIVVSACYSGSFLNSLKDDHTLVLTAARADRTSFGCSDDADFTYFGRAYLEQALNHSTSFVAAFDEARTLVRTWEQRDHLTPSEPQMAKGALIEGRLEQWRATLEAAPQAAVPAARSQAHPPR